MEYRRLGPSGQKVSLLGFGAMRLPDISQRQASAAVRRAVALGVNYFETAPGYGDSEVKLGKALGTLREQVLVSTKSMKVSGSEVRRDLETSLSRMGMDYVDWYQLWTMTAERIPEAFGPGGALKAIRRAMDEGLIHHLGATSHDTPDNCIRLVETGELESITVPYNAVEQEYEKVVGAAAERGMGVVVMRPLAGGLLARPSGDVGRVLDDTAVPTTAAKALAFLAANPGVSTIIAGMKSAREVEENYQSVLGATRLSQEEQQAIQALFAPLGERFCTTCGYCLPCPAGIDIPTVLRLYADALIYGIADKSRRKYRELAVKFGEACTECAECEEACPNRMQVIERLREAEAFLLSR